MQDNGGKVFGARIQGFVAGIGVAVVIGAIWPPVRDLLDWLGDKHPGWVLGGMVGLGILGFSVAAWRMRRT